MATKYQGKSGYIFGEASPITVGTYYDAAGNPLNDIYLEDLTNKIGAMREWSITESGSTEDTSELGDGMWGSKEVVKYEWNGSTTGFFTDANTLKLGDKIYSMFIINTDETTTVYTNADGTGAVEKTPIKLYKYGYCVVNGVDTSGSVDGIVKQNFSFEGLGELKTNTI